jgi:hypothetical protein
MQKEEKVFSTAELILKEVSIHIISHTFSRSPNLSLSSPIFSQIRASSTYENSLKMVSIMKVKGL